MADEKKDAKTVNPKLRDRQARRKLFKHALGDAKRDETVKALPKGKRRRVAAAKARKAFRVTEKARAAAAAAKQQAAPPASA